MPREKVADPLLRDVGKADAIERLGDALLALGRRKGHQPPGVMQIVGGGEIVVEADLIRQVADAPLDRQRLAHRIVPHHPRLAAADLGEAEQHQDGGGLAGAIRPEQAENLARRDGKRHAVDRGRIAVVLGEAVRLDDGVVHGWVAHRRPNRVTAPTMISNAAPIMPTPAMPHSVEVATVTRKLAVPVSPRAALLNVVT